MMSGEDFFLLRCSPKKNGSTFIFCTRVYRLQPWCVDRRFLPEFSFPKTDYILEIVLTKTSCKMKHWLIWTHLDSFWTHFGLILDLFWTHFRLILTHIGLILTRNDSFWLILISFDSFWLIWLHKCSIWIHCSRACRLNISILFEDKTSSKVGEK